MVFSQCFLPCPLHVVLDHPGLWDYDFLGGVAYGQKNTNLVVHHFPVSKFSMFLEQHYKEEWRVSITDSVNNHSRGGNTMVMDHNQLKKQLPGLKIFQVPECQFRETRISFAECLR